MVIDCGYLPQNSQLSAVVGHTVRNYLLAVQRGVLRCSRDPSTDQTARQLPQNK